MNPRVLLILLVAAAGVSSTAVASDAPSKKEPADPPKAQPAPTQSKPALVEPQAKREEPLKWDQIDPKSVEQRAKAQRTLFVNVPAER